MSAPDFTPDELATLQRIEAADPAPESYIGSDGLTNDERRKWMPRIGNGLEPDELLAIDTESSWMWARGVIDEAQS